jgi:hypothetical protein
VNPLSVSRPLASYSPWKSSVLLLPIF